MSIRRHRFPAIAAAILLATSVRVIGATTDPALAGAKSAEGGGDASADGELRVAEKATFTNGLGMKFVKVPGTDVLFSVWDTRVQDYTAFVRALNRTWIKPGFEQGPTHPAVYISWCDAQTFCWWLTLKERREHRIGPHDEYRLPTDAEWSMAAGLDSEEGRTPKDKDRQTPGVYPWGEVFPPPKGSGNYADRTMQKSDPLCSPIAGYDDGFAYTSPVGSFKANRFGLFDMGGNVWQLCEDPYEPGQMFHVTRGASFRASAYGDMQTSARSKSADTGWDDNTGFRCVLVGWSPAQERVYTHALAFCAVLSSLDNEPVADLRSRQDWFAELQHLRQSCNVGTHDDLLQALSELEEGGLGRRSGLWVASRAMGYQGGSQHGTLPATGWDFAQYIAMCRSGYNAHYLSEEEAWGKILPVARLLQLSFHSWNEFASDFLLGCATSAQSAADRDVGNGRDIVSSLTADPDGLWAKIPWNESLGKGRAAVDSFADRIRQLNGPGKGDEEQGLSKAAKSAF